MAWVALLGGDAVLQADVRLLDLWIGKHYVCRGLGNRLVNIRLRSAQVSCDGWGEEFAPLVIDVQNFSVENVSVSQTGTCIKRGSIDLLKRLPSALNLIAQILPFRVRAL